MVFCLLAALVAAPAFASGSLSVERDDTSGVSWICGGERLLVFSARPPDGAVNHYDCPGICPLGITYSDDDGATWRMAPRAEVSSIMPPTGFIQLKDGSVALFGQVRKYLGTKSYAPASDQDIWMATSPDGLKWSAPRVVAYVLEALLGADEDRLMRDWETTALRNGNVKVAHEARYDKLVASFKKDFPADTVRERVEKYVLSLGFTQDDIEKFRSIMLE